MSQPARAAGTAAAAQPLPASRVAMRTRNPIRAIVDGLSIPPNPTKALLSLALGDPTTHGNFPPSAQCMAAVAAQLHSATANGYAPSVGLEVARAAIATHYAISGPDSDQGGDQGADQQEAGDEAPAPLHALTARDVIIASGCSDAINLCIGALADEGQNLLLPAPGFSLYETLASSKGIECRFYPLLPERGWEVDLQALEGLIDARTAGIVVNNPSNPCGSVYARQHLLDLLSIARRHGLPILSDEIYAGMAFQGHTFHPLASLTEDVPLLVVGGLAKRHLVPGWRIGWLVVYDKTGRLDQVRRGLVNLSQLILGANTLIQKAIPAILRDTPASFYADTLSKLEHHALLCASLLQGIPGLVPGEPQGAMYLMVQILLKHFPGIQTDVEFVQRLVDEEAVLCLPGSCFRCPQPFFRVVITLPEEMLEQAFQRIRSFCTRHYQP